MKAIVKFVQYKIGKGSETSIWVSRKQLIGTEQYRRVVFFLLVNFTFFTGFEIITAEGLRKETTHQKLCGPLSLQTLFKLVGEDVSIEAISLLSQFDEESGTTMYGLAKAARKLGFNAIGMRLKFKELAKQKHPVIAFVRENHFLVVEKVVDNQLRVIEPGRPPALISGEDFSEIWRGHVLVISKKLVSKKNQPHIQFEETVYNYGDARQQKTITHQFRFKNAGNAPLIISEIDPSCACTATLLSEEVIPPAGQGVVEMKFPTEFWRGKRTVSVNVRSNDPDKPAVTLTLTGNVAGWIPVVPNYIDFGDVAGGNEKIQRRIHVLDPGHGKLTIKDVKTSTTNLVTTVHDAGKQTTEILVTLHPGLPPGIFKDKVIILTNDRKSPEVVVWVKAYVHGEILMSPKQFFFGFLAKGKTASEEIIITNRGQNLLEIVKVESSSEMIHTEVVAIEKGRKYSIKAIYTASEETGTRKDIIKVHTNHQEHAVLKVPLYVVIQ